MAKTRFVAKAIILDANGDFLLLKRTDSHPMLANFYDLPGGTVKAGEEPGEAVLREVREETGLLLNKTKMRVLYTTTNFLHGRSFPTMLYIATLDNIAPNVQISWEHQSYEWAPLSKLSEVEPQLAPTYREALNYIREHDVIKDIYRDAEV